MSALAVERLPRAREVLEARAACEAPPGRARSLARADLKWALIDQAREIADDPHARALAERLAGEGDEEACDALVRADDLPAELPPTSTLTGGDVTRVRGSTAVLPLGAQAGPLPQLREVLAEHRRDGCSFTTAWTRAINSLCGSSGEWRQILEATKPAWRANYERTQTPKGYDLIGAA